MLPIVGKYVADLVEGRVSMLIITHFDDSFRTKIGIDGGGARKMWAK